MPMLNESRCSMHGEGKWYSATGLSQLHAESRYLQQRGHLPLRGDPLGDWHLCGVVDIQLKRDLSRRVDRQEQRCQNCARHCSALPDGLQIVRLAS